MTEKNQNAPASQVASGKKQPDLVFKQLTLEKALETGLKNISTEIHLPQSTRGDLILTVPEGSELKLEKTLFDFFRAINVVEFKSENDPFDERKFLKNVMRVDAIYNEDENLTFEKLLNVFVLAHLPQNFLRFAQEFGYEFEKTKNREWLLQENFGFQRVAIVICEKLPLEEKYYQWLVFAPSKTKKWHDFVKQLILTGKDDELLKAASAMREKEAQMVYKELIDSGELDPQEKARITKDRIEAIQIALNDFQKNPEELSLALSGIQPEKILSGLKPEERVAGLKPEEIAQGLNSLSPEEREKILALLLKQSDEKK